MFGREDHTYSELNKNASLQWLNEQVNGQDIVNRDGAKVTLEYITRLTEQIKSLESKNDLKDSFLRKLKAEKMIDKKLMG